MVLTSLSCFRLKAWYIAVLVLIIVACSKANDVAGDQEVRVGSRKNEHASKDSVGTPSASTISSPDYSIYHTKDDLLASVANIVDSTRSLTLETLEESVDDGEDPDEKKPYKARIQVVTYDVQFDNSLLENDRPKIVFDFGEHGRELITTEVGLAFLRSLSDDAELHRLVRKYEILDSDFKKVREILNLTLIKIVPMENENGRGIVEDGEMCERKNGRGVDPNRNWSVDWGVKEPDYDPQEEYPGTRAFSEPEVIILKNLAEGFRPDVFVNVHSGMEAMFVPYDHRNEIAYGSNVNATLDILYAINHQFCDEKCSIGSGGASVGYLAHGTLTDYLHEELKIPITSTWEIYGDHEARFDDCFRMFNPLDRETLDLYVDRWVATLIFFITQLPNHPATISKYRALEGANISKEHTNSSSPFSINPANIPLGQQSSISYYQLIGILLAAALLYKARHRISSRAKEARDKVKTEDLLPRFAKRKKHYISIS